MKTNFYHSVKRIFSFLLIFSLIAACVVVTANAAYYVIWPEEGYYIIKPAANSGYALDVKGGGNAAKKTAIQLYETNGTDAQVFYLECVNRNEGWYLIRHVRTGYVLNVVNGEGKNDGRLWLYHNDNTDACYFRFADAGNGYCLIQAKVAGGKYIIDLDNARCFNEAIIHLWSLHGGLSAQWQLVKTGANKSYSDQMSISQSGIDFLCSLEGFHAQCYWDYSQSSIGFGTRCGTGGAHSSGSHSISREDALSRLKTDLKNTYEPKVRQQTVGIKLTQNQYDVLVSLCFNTGGGGTKNPVIRNSPLVKYLVGELSEREARNAYSNYYVNAGGSKLAGLVNRRNKEADRFFTDVTDSGRTIANDTNKQYFARCSSSCTTITSGLENIGENSSYNYRKQIAAVNGISGYSGTAEQNNLMLKYLKEGRLIKP
jgi:GH24 family phage-related lysozyme (muramidase)